MLRLRGAVAAALMIAAVLTLPATTLAGSLELNDGVVGSPPPPMRDVQETIWFQGFLADGVSGDPVNATYAVEARVYAVEVGGSSIWGPETHGAVPITDGWFSIELGSVLSPLPDFQSPPYYLQLTIDGEILAPRLKLASVPTALHSDGIDLPYYGSYSGSGDVFEIVNSGPNRCGYFRVNNPSSTAGALYGQHNGPGPATMGLHTGEGPALKGIANGTGLAGEFVGAVTISDSLAVEGVLMARGSAVVLDTLLAGEGFWFAKDPVPGYVLRCADSWGFAEWAPANVIDTHYETGTTIIGSSATQYDDCQVTLTVPGPGYIVVESQLWVVISHTAGTDDHFVASISESPTSMAPSYARWSAFDIPAPWPTEASAHQTVYVHNTFPVTESGTYTYYLVGYMYDGQDSLDRFWYASMRGTWYPHPVTRESELEGDTEFKNKMDLLKQ